MATQNMGSMMTGGVKTPKKPATPVRASKKATAGTMPLPAMLPTAVKKAVTKKVSTAAVKKASASTMPWK